MKMKRLIICLMSVFILVSCVKEDYFGLSSYGNIKSIEVSNLAGIAVINTDSQTISLPIANGVDLSEIMIQSLTLSSFASSDLIVGDTIDLTTAQSIVVTAEDGSLHQWILTAEIASSTPQLTNGDFSMWYLTSDDYYEPGESAATTIWGTGNPGSNTIGRIATKPYDAGDGNKMARLETLDNGIAGVPLNTPISAGSIFTGVFNTDKINPTNPEAAIDFGTPFVGRPVKLRFTYSYVPGATNEDRKGNVLDYSDACDIYALLEVRDGSTTKRLATAWFRGSESQSTLTTVEVVFTYGELDSSFPDYMKPTTDEYVSSDSASYLLPTHITFVASSSYDGAKFCGAVGSVLMLDDVEMVYE